MSPIYKLSVPFFDNGTPKELIKFQHELQAVLKGQNHNFPENARQTQKRYMRRSLWLAGEMTVKEWVAWVSESKNNLKDFPAQNRNKIQPLDKDKIMDILEYGVPALWCREFTIQGFDPVDQ
eukprot:13641383-Ditylum_brightwellii.AAC.1